MKKKNLILILAFPALMLTLFFKAEGQNTLIGPTTTNIQIIRNVSSDGQYVVGQTATEPRQAFTWNVTSGNAITQLGGSAGANRLSEAFDVTDNNRVASDFADPDLLFDELPIRSAGFWENGNWTGLGLGLAAGAPPHSLIAGSSAKCITSDGNTIGGFCQTYIGGVNHVHPYTWTYNADTDSWDGTTWAEPSNVTQGSAIVSMSGDGSIATGWTNIGGAARTGILWKSPTQFQIFDGGVPGDYSEFICVSRNGKYAGYRHNANCGIYDVENDEYYSIPGGILINAVSDNGLAIGAYKNEADVVKGFVWSKELGYMDFRDFVSTYASDVLIPVSLQNVLNPTTINPYIINAISADGLSITLWAANKGFVLKFEAPIVVAPAPKNLTATVDRNLRNKVVLTWSAPENGEWSELLENYSIYRDGEVIETVESDLLTYTDNNVEAGYKNYSVRAIYENAQSNQTDPAEAVIADNYDIPFFEDFNSVSFKTNYWTPSMNKSKYSWNVIEQGGVESKSPGVQFEVRYSQNDPFSATLISKPLDATNETSVYLTFMAYAHSISADKLFVDVSTNGVTWTNMSEYSFQQLIDWRYEILDISSVAAGELINVRFRMEGFNNSNDTRFYFFDNINVSSTIPEGNAIPLNIIHKENEISLELAWQNPEGLYGLTYQQTPLRYTFGNDGDKIIAVQSFGAEELAIYKEQYLTSISTYVNQKINNPTVSITLKLAVFADGVRVVNQEITDFTPNAWNTFTLSTPYLLSKVNNNLQIGIEVVSHDFYELPLGADEAGRAVAGKGDLYSIDDGKTWKLLSDEAYAGYHRNWCIIGNVSAEPTNAQRTDDILGYNVYLDDQKINEHLMFGQTFTTEKLEGTYTVKAYSLTTGISKASEPFIYKIENQIKENPLSDILVYSHQNTVYIKDKSNTGIKAVEIFDIMGRNIYKSAVNNTDISISLFVTNGIYLVKLISQDNIISTTKVLINN
jgi:hypothetical protein